MILKFILGEKLKRQRETKNPKNYTAQIVYIYIDIYIYISIF